MDDSKDSVAPVLEECVAMEYNVDVDSYDNFGSCYGSVFEVEDEPPCKYSCMAVDCSQGCYS